MKTKETAALLAFFLGTFGAHWFYLGNIKFGILFLLFSWTGIPTVIGVITSIVFMLTPDETFKQWHL